MTTTRFTTSLLQVPAVQSQSGILVRIYPQEGIGQPFEVGSEKVTVGRDHASLTLPDDSVSRQHATIHWNGQAHVVTDSGSTNGTYVNEERISSRALVSGDRVRFGNQLLKYLSAGSLESKYHELVFKIMTTDGLTQTHNKSYFMESFQRELHLGQRTEAPLCLMLLDLDHFKRINDSYGHLAGDKALIEFASRTLNTVRRGDLLARYGGEEFVLLCPRTKFEHGLQLAERIRRAVAEKPVEFETQRIPMTVSIGVVEFSVGSSNERTNFDVDSLSTVLLAEADKYLYQAKQRGRNQVASCFQALAPAPVSSSPATCNPHLANH